MRAGSGATGSLLTAMEELVAEVVPISGALPAAVGRAAHLSSLAARIRPRGLGDVRGSASRVHAAAKLGRPTIVARGLLLRRRLPAPAALDGIVQRGSEMRLPTGYRVVTFEDSTVAQARAGYPWPHLRGLSEQDLRRYVDRQRRVYESAVACCCATHWVAESIVDSYGIRTQVLYYKIDSNLPNYTTNNFSVAVGPTYRF